MLEVVQTLDLSAITRKYEKEDRGCRQFLLRGMEKMRGEWSLICTTHNLLKLFPSRERAIA